MSRRVRKRVFSILRIVACIVFVYFAVRGVTWHDMVTLKADGGGEGGRFQLVSVGEDSVVIVRADGGEEEVAWDRIAVDESGEEAITYGLVTAVGECDKRFLLLALVIFAPTTLLQSLRYKMVLKAQDIHLSYWMCVKLCYGGNFLNFVFLIGSTAGDVFKAYYTAQHTTRKTEAVTTILFDRAIGLTGLLLVAGAMIPLGTDNSTLRGLGIFVAVVLAGLVIGSWVIMSSWVSSLASRPFFARLPGWGHVLRAHGATEILLRQKSMLFWALVLSVMLQFICISSGVCCAYALHMDFSDTKIWDYYAYIGSGFLVAAIPISPMGLGTMEFAYKTFFLGTYGTLSQLLCLALWLRLLTLFWALPGAMVTLLGSYRLPDAKQIEEAHLS